MRTRRGSLLLMAAVVMAMLPASGLAYSRAPRPVVGTMSSPSAAFYYGTVDSCAALTAGDYLEGYDFDGSYGGYGSSATLGDFFDGDGFVYDWSFYVVRMFGSTPAVEMWLDIDNHDAAEENRERGAGLYLYGALTCDGDIATITGRWMRNSSYGSINGAGDVYYSYFTGGYVECGSIYGDVTGGGTFTATIDVANGTFNASLSGTVGFDQRGVYPCESPV